MTLETETAVAEDGATAHSGLNRRKLLLAGAWATPAVVLTVPTSVAAASGPAGAHVDIVRAGSGDWTNWEGADAKAPGFRFFNSTNKNVIATINFAQTGSGNVSIGNLFNVYNGIDVSGPTGAYSFLVTIPPLGAAGHVGITLKKNNAAIGTYALDFGTSNETLAVRNEGGQYQVISPA